jgi:hypothetical protein
MGDIKYTCNGPRLELVDVTGKPQNKAVENFLINKGKEGQPAAMAWAAKIKKQTDAGFRSIRMGCGTDYTKLIEEVPYDGEVHEVVCPSCGTPTTVRRTPVTAEDKPN